MFDAQTAKEVVRDTLRAMLPAAYQRERQRERDAIKSLLAEMGVNPHRYLSDIGEEDSYAFAAARRAVLRAIASAVVAIEARDERDPPVGERDAT